jgi:hypothetical protein
MAIARPSEELALQAQGQPVQRTSPRPAIELRGDLLSVRLRNVPWQAVLTEIQRQTGIMIHVEGRMAGALTQEFESLPLEKGLRTLFRDANVAFLYAAGAAEAATVDTLSRIWLFPRERIRGDAGLSRRSVPELAAEPQDEPGSLEESADIISPGVEAKLEGERMSQADQTNDAQQESLEELPASTEDENEVPPEEPDPRSD